MLMAPPDTLGDVENLIPWATVERVTVIGMLLLIVMLLVTGRILSRKTADREVESLKEGYAAKDEAHNETVAHLRERVESLVEQNIRQNELLAKRDAQLSKVLDEVAPSLIAWADATQTVVEETTDGGDGNVGS